MAANVPEVPPLLTDKLAEHSDDDLSPSLEKGSLADGTLQQVIIRNGQEVLVTWTKDEERSGVRKADFLFLPIFAMLFTWMAIDRTNVSGVLTSTFLKDTNMTRDQANTGVSLLWFGIVLLEIPSNVSKAFKRTSVRADCVTKIVLHRVGPHYWIPIQVLVWGTIEVLQYKVTNASGWYAARLFLGLAESGFIPGTFLFFTLAAPLLT